MIDINPFDVADMLNQATEKDEICTIEYRDKSGSSLLKINGVEYRQTIYVPAKRPGALEQLAKLHEVSPSIPEDGCEKIRVFND